MIQTIDINEFWVFVPFFFSFYLDRHWYNLVTDILIVRLIGNIPTRTSFYISEHVMILIWWLRCYQIFFSIREKTVICTFKQPVSLHVFGRTSLSDQILCNFFRYFIMDLKFISQLVLVLRRWRDIICLQLGKLL